MDRSRPDEPEAAAGSDEGVGGDEAVLDALARAELRPVGAIASASNTALLVSVGDPADDVLAVYKPRIGERPLWDFPDGTLHLREVAAYVVSAALRWDLVPPTVLRHDGPEGPGSVQLFVPHDPRVHYFVLCDHSEFHDELARLALFDLLVNNADRKGGHVLLDGDGRIRGIDHGVTFHVQPKLRTVIWELGGRRIAKADRRDVQGLAEALATPTSAVASALLDLLAPVEVEVTARRAERLAERARLPDVPEDRRPYPWPPL